MKFTLIAAADSKNGIGKEGKLPWNLPSELKFFTATTVGSGNNAVLMGRNTWESIPEKHRPLKDRQNIIISTQKNLTLPPNIKSYSNLETAISETKANKLFIIGGGKIYSQAIKLHDCNEIILTRVEGDFGCNTFFPEIDESVFKLTDESDEHEENGVKYKFQTYKRID